MECLAGGYRLIGSLPFLLEIKGIMQTAHLPTPRGLMQGPEWAPRRLLGKAEQSEGSMLEKEAKGSAGRV